MKKTIKDLMKSFPDGMDVSFSLKVLKLRTGQDVITEVSDISHLGYRILSNPCEIHKKLDRRSMQPIISITPLHMYSDDMFFLCLEDDIITETDVGAEYKEIYFNYCEQNAMTEEEKDNIMFSQILETYQPAEGFTGH